MRDWRRASFGATPAPPREARDAKVAPQDDDRKLLFLSRSHCPLVLLCGAKCVFRVVRVGTGVNVSVWHFGDDRKE